MVGTYHATLAKKPMVEACLRLHEWRRPYLGCLEETATAISLCYLHLDPSFFASDFACFQYYGFRSTDARSSPFKTMG